MSLYGENSSLQMQKLTQFQTQNPGQNKKRVALRPATRDPHRSFGNVLQPSTSFPEKRAIYNKPNPHDRLWNPSPTKKAKAREREVINSYDYDKENESNESSERRYLGKEVGRERISTRKNEVSVSEAAEEADNRRNEYIINYSDTHLTHPASATHKSAAVPLIPSTSTSSDLNNSFTEKISNLEIGFQVESSPTNTATTSSITPPQTLWNERRFPEFPYITEILNYWHTLEVNYSIDPNYMFQQKEISHKMRTILTDWIAEVCDECKLCNATFHKCIQYVDRFLSKVQISRNNLQLLGITCLFIACKIEEIHPPETGDLVLLTDNTYDKSQLLRMECLVVSKLDFDLLIPTASEFTEYFSSCLALSPTAKEFSTYVIDLCILYGEKFLRFNQSVTAAAACYVAIRCCGDNSASAPNSDTSIPSILKRISRLHANKEFHSNVEQAASLMFGTLMIIGSESDSGNSICSRYPQFQDQKYFVAAASCAACCSLPWYNVGLLNENLI